MEKSSSNSYELPEYAKYDTDSKIPDVLENYYQGVFDALTLAACKPVRIKYSPNGSTVTSTRSHRFFILSRGDLASWSYSDGDRLNATVVNALVSSVGNNVSLLLRSTTDDYDTKLDPDSNTYVQDGDKYGAVYIARIINNRLYDTSYTVHGHEAASVLPCIVLYDTAGVGETASCGETTSRKSAATTSGRNRCTRSTTTSGWHTAYTTRTATR